MVTTSAPEAMAPMPGIEQTNASGYQRALRLGMKHDAAVLAAAHPAYLDYYRIVHPMDFRVAFSSKDPVNDVLTRLGYDVSGIAEPVRKAKDEDGEVIRPQRGW